MARSPASAHRRPTALKVLNGSAEHHPERRNPTEPVPTGRPEMPPDLSPAEQAVWHRVLAVLPAGVITAADEGIFQAYCQERALVDELRKLVATSGLIVRSSHARGDVTKNPLLGPLRDRVSLMRALAGDLGLTPAARSGVAAPPARSAQSDGMAELLKPRRRTS